MEILFTEGTQLTPMLKNFVNCFKCWKHRKLTPTQDYWHRKLIETRKCHNYRLPAYLMSITGAFNDTKHRIRASFWYTGRNRYCLFSFDFIPFAAILDTLSNNQQPPSWICFFRFRLETCAFQMKNKYFKLFDFVRCFWKTNRQQIKVHHLDNNSKLNRFRH